MNSILKIGLVAAATAVGTVGLTAPAVAQDYRATTPARIEAIPIQTLTVSTEQLLTGDHYAGPTVIAGSLLVAPGEGPRPLVVFLSGGSGYGSGSYTSWADQFLEMGISVFFLDAFAGRGLVSGELEWEYTILDLYQALGVLADHPRVDSDNIAVMGWSRGATVALYSAMDRFHQLWNTSGVEPVAYIALYPVCWSTYIDDTDLRDRRVRIFHGTEDDLAPIAQCRSYVERLAAAGADVTLTEFEGAHHVFDWGGMPQEPLRLERPGVGNCEWTEATPGILTHVTTGEPRSLSATCFVMGVHFAYSPAATDATEIAVKALLTDVFGLE